MLKPIERARLGGGGQRGIDQLGRADRLAVRRHALGKSRFEHIAPSDLSLHVEVVTERIDEGAINTSLTPAATAEL